MDRKELIEQNLGLVHACANRFRGRGIEYEELYSAGCLGLVKAADGFREELGFAFSTYAVPAVLYNGQYVAGFLPGPIRGRACPCSRCMQR